MSVMTPIFAGLWEHYIFWSLVVGAIAFGWLFHHSFWFTSKDGESLPNVDEIKLGVFPKHNDDMRLEVAWTVLPFILIVWLTYYSWGPLDAMWTSADGGMHGNECEEGQFSNNTMDMEASASASSGTVDKAETQMDNRNSDSDSYKGASASEDKGSTKETQKVDQTADADKAPPPPP